MLLHRDSDALGAAKGEGEQRARGLDSLGVGHHYLAALALILARGEARDAVAAQIWQLGEARDAFPDCDAHAVGLV